MFFKRIILILFILNKFVYNVIIFVRLNFMNDLIGINLKVSIQNILINMFHSYL